MIFPKLVTDGKEYTIPSGSRKVKKYKLDWSNLDQKRIDNKVKWFSNYHIDKLTDYQKDIFKNEILKDCDWSIYNGVPEQYQYILDMFEYVYLPDSYHNEILHFEELALQEWNRPRPFDTSVRETCLDVAKSSVDMFFYLLNDGVYIYNDKFNSRPPTPADVQNYNLYRSREENMMPILWKFKFWKHQTGGGLVVRNAFSRIRGKYSKFDFMQELRNDLEENMQFNLLGIDYIPRFDNDDPDQNLVNLVKQYIRDKKIKELEL